MNRYNFMLDIGFYRNRWGCRMECICDGCQGVLKEFQTVGQEIEDIDIFWPCGCYRGSRYNVLTKHKFTLSHSCPKATLNEPIPRLMRHTEAGITESIFGQIANEAHRVRQEIDDINRSQFGWE